MQSARWILGFLFFICTDVQGQFKKGQIMAGVSISNAMFATGKASFSFPNGTQGYTAKLNNRDISIAPSAGVFLNGRSVLGGQIIFNHSYRKEWQESSGTTYKKDEWKSTDYGLGLFFRHYLSPGARILPFIQTYFQAGSGSTRTNGFYYQNPDYYEEYRGKSSDRFFYHAGINGGLSKMLSPSVGIEAFIGYDHSYSAFTSETKKITNSPGNNVTYLYQPRQKMSLNGLAIGISFQVFIAKNGRRSVD